MSTAWTAEANGVGAYANLDGPHLYPEHWRPIILPHGRLGRYGRS